jgi:DNA-binding transcriptional ArsR family regulator
MTCLAEALKAKAGSDGAKPSRFASECFTPRAQGSQRFEQLVPAPNNVERVTNNPAPDGRSLVLAAERSPDQVNFDRQVVDFFVSAADLLGVPKSVAAIYGIVFASPEPLSFADIESRLDISKGSISQGLRVLREVGALREAELPEGPRGRGEEDLKGRRSDPPTLRTSEPPDARRAPTRYEPDLALRKLIERFLESRLQKQLDAGKGRLASLKKAVPAGRNGDSKMLRERINALESWNGKARSLLPIARTFLKLTPL